ncbi:Uncharacterised protein [uncultured archaeon]|nr:Uncharacterised protein [uncultured archaeon]
MNEVRIFPMVGQFAGNKDVAREIRLRHILPAIEIGEGIILDFENVDSATQSFIHAMISDVIRKKGAEAIEKIYFKNCNVTIQKIINIVVQYMQESL